MSCGSCSGYRLNPKPPRSHERIVSGSSRHAHISLAVRGQPGTLPRRPQKDRGAGFLRQLASVWEIAIKVNLGKLRLQGTPAKYVIDQMTLNGFAQLEISLHKIMRCVSLEGHQRFFRSAAGRTGARRIAGHRVARSRVRPLWHQTDLVNLCAFRISALQSNTRFTPETPNSQRPR
jgi:hypothetical protein